MLVDNVYKKSRESVKADPEDEQSSESIIYETEDEESSDSTESSDESYIESEGVIWSCLKR